MHELKTESILDRLDIVYYPATSFVSHTWYLATINIP